MITITSTNGQVYTWNKEKYTDYTYDGKCFIVVKDDKWVGFYNIDNISTIIIC